MKRGFYLKLGFEGIRKNKQLYTPYLLSCTLMVLMFYMLSALGENPYLGSLRGGRTTQSVLQLGSFVMIIFSALLLFYSNSFMIRRRHREFGLYNVLGMSKRHIGRILLWESFLSGFFSLASGLIGGILFSKLFELGLLYLLKEQINYSITVSVTSLVGTVLYFGFVFCLLFIRSLFTLGRLKPTELLKAEKVGEKPPKANWVLAIIGALILSAAYFIAIIAPDPITALALFFLAVILVIIATYLLFISGSVSLCRFLQNRKGYYYKSNHFISVSSMAYRMKRNGAGLGSICIDRKSVV